MFTGIITAIGSVQEITPKNKGLMLKIACNTYNSQTIPIGASIACNGICLTVTQTQFEHEKNSSNRENKTNKDWFIVEAWEEALRLTTIANWHLGEEINLERSLKIGDSLCGHLVSGHVDGVAKILSIQDEGEAKRFLIKAPDNLAPFIAQKGSIALDGTSLTVNAVENNHFNVLIIKHTLEVTNWKNKSENDNLNIEIDQLARYAVRFLETQQNLLKK